MCELLSYEPDGCEPAAMRNGDIMRVVAKEDPFADDILCPVVGEDAVYVLSNPKAEATGAVLFCRHPEEENPDWEALPWPQEGESVRVPVGSELKLVLAPSVVEEVDNRDGRRPPYRRGGL